MTTDPQPADAGPGTRPDSGQRPLWPMDPQLKDIQPGGGIVIRLEQAWGRIRRWWLRSFRAAYVRRMAECRRGDFNPCPHDVLDPRDLKFHRNQGGWHWDADDDPFRWRDRIPFARVGLAELLLLGGGSLLVAVAAGAVAGLTGGALRITAATLAIAAAVIGGLITWFFRDPSRRIPDDPRLIVSPADGKVVDVEDILHDDDIGGPARKVGIFLSIFNVHINRSPIAGRTIGLRYRPGLYLNALRPESARENEQLAILIESTAVPHRLVIVRQITGAIARRIVCWLKPGDLLARGEQFGMIKLGSRTELLLPAEPGLEIRVRVGDHVKAGSTVLAAWPETADPSRTANSENTAANPETNRNTPQE